MSTKINFKPRRCFCWRFRHFDCSRKGKYPSFIAGNTCKIATRRNEINLYSHTISMDQDTPHFHPKYYHLSTSHMMKYTALCMVIVLSAMLVKGDDDRKQEKAIQSLKLIHDIDCDTLTIYFPNCNFSSEHHSFVHNIKGRLPTEIGKMSTSDIYSLEIASFCLGVLLTMVAVSIRFSLSHDEIEALIHSEK
jgi:hypothetical protein